MSDNTSIPAGKLSSIAVEYLRAHSTELTLSAGDTVVHQGEPGRNFYLVLEGELEVRLASAEGCAMAITRLGAGATFGEIALLRSEPISADVVAVTAATVLACPALSFHSALAECEDLRTELLTRLAGDLRRTTREAWDFFQKAEAMRLLARGDCRHACMVATSARMQGLVQELGELATTMEPVLITGAAGTGKMLAAQVLHQQSQTPDTNMITIDCLRIEDGDAGRLVLGASDPAAAESTPQTPGAIHLARGGTLVLRHADRLDQPIQEAVARITGELGDALRLVVTLRADSAEEADALLAPALAAGFGTRRVHLPPLAERRRDILPLARHFLARLPADPPLRLAQDAEYALVSQPYRHRNVAELREALDLAAACADEDQIRAEDLFSGPIAENHPTGLDISNLGAVRALVHRGWLQPLRIVVLASFVAVILLCIFAGSTRSATWANTFIWAAWEPAVFALFLLVGSVWCTVCPLSAAGRLAQRLATLGLPPSRWLKRHGVWLAIGGFFLIVWVERVFHMTSNPPASGWMLLGLISASVFFCLVYNREVWCRHACPLGALASSLAPSALLQVGANPGVCTSTCTDHSCYRGAASVPGCTVFHHPLDADEDHLCKLCLDCLQSCPHDSARLFLRPPLSGAWRIRGASVDLAPFACAIFGLTLVLLASRSLSWLQTPLHLTAAGIGAIIAGTAVHRLLLPLLFCSTENDSLAAERVAFALMVLGWGPLMADQLANIPALDQFYLSTAEGSAWAGIVGSAGLSLRLLAQMAVLLLAAALAAISLVRIRQLAVRSGAKPSVLGWASLAVLCFLYLGSAIALLLVPCLRF